MTRASAVAGELHEAQPLATVMLHLRDGIESTIACIEALASNTPDEIAFQTIVVDDATSDRTAEFLRALSGDVCILRNDAPLGFGRSVNEAADLARAPLLVFLDQQTAVEVGWLVPLLARMSGDATLGAVQPLIVGSDRKIWSAGGRFSAAGVPILRGQGLRSLPEGVFQTEICDFVDGSCAVVRKNAFEDAGGFDPAYPEGPWTFADLSLALAGDGWTLGFERSSTVSRREPPDLRNGRRRLRAKWPSSSPVKSSRARSVAFYLPQFHPIPENDLWWGPGFTEWTNVAKAVPAFAGHEQPHLPADLGFYDLRVPETREAQAELAKAHGVDAFCYYHYWFGGKRLLERPLDEVLRSGEPAMKFCLCWANEDWHRNWDGRSGEILVPQEYSEDDDRAHIEWLVPVFGDARYLRVDGKPLFLVYRASLLPDARRTTELWRDVARSAGVGELLLCRVESFPEEHDDPRELGFDASVEFQPDWLRLETLPRRPDLAQTVYEYSDVVTAMLEKPEVPWRRIPAVTPRWDNTPRNASDPFILSGSNPETYATWVSGVVEREGRSGVAEPIVFVNAWNEWGEGAHLEPCQSWGSDYLRAHRDGLGAPVAPRRPTRTALCIAGMHRSGTSLTASWLERCGLPVHTGRVVGAATGNVRGHYEDLDFMRVNELAIRQRWPGSDGWKVEDDAPCHLTGDSLRQATELVAERSRSYVQWGWKDPRSTLLLESWADVLGGEAIRTLLLWRPCRQVVASIVRRSEQTDDPVMQLDVHRAIRVWIAYNRRVCEYRRLYPDDTVLVETDSVVSDAENVHKLICDRLRIELEYVALSDVYDAELLGADGAGLPSGLEPLGDEVAELERMLAELSDV